VNIRTVTKEELISILNVTPRALKAIEYREQLSQRLFEKGYTLIQKTKKGRKVFYEIKEEQEEVKAAHNVIEYYYNTKSFQKFSDYFTCRTTCAKEDICTTITQISDVVDVSEKTVSKWDSMLVDKSILSKDGYYYFSREEDSETGEYINRRISKEEYTSFWQNKGYAKAMQSLQDKYDNGLITFNELQIAIADASEILKVINNKYCFRIKKYLVNETNPMYIDTVDLINGVYTTTITPKLLSIEG